MNGLTDDEVESMLQASYDHAQADFDARRVADLKTELGVMLLATDKGLAHATDQLDPESLEDIDLAARTARAMIDGVPAADEIQAARDELERATTPLAAVLMDSVAKAALSGKNLSDV